ncbi:MAG: hypothetical protein AAF081_06305 [Actinomycetota bacterium]
MTRRQRFTIAAVLAGVAVLGATPAGAHGIGGRTDLPLPAWQLAWAAGFAVASSFVALGAFWSQPRLVAAAEGGRTLADTRQPALRGLEFVTKSIGVFLFGVLLWAAWWGNPNGAVNIAGDALLIWFWVGLQLVSFLFGDVWRLFNPYVTVADTAAWSRARIRGEELEPLDEETAPPSLWPAVAAIFAYLWYELAYHSTDSPRAIAVFLTAYSVAMIGGAMVEGRGWVRRADGFAVLFTKLAAMSPTHRDADGRLRLRSPLAGLARLPDIPGTVPFILVVLGSTTFDGFTRSSLWLDIAGEQTGWGRTITSTVGLLVITGLVAMAYSIAISAMANITDEEPAELSRVFGPTLVPIAAAYAVAHYFSFLVLTGQRMFIRISDPAGRGWDLFGTADYAIDWTIVSPDTIAWVQTLAIAIGHVAGVAAAHDVAISRYDHQLAVKSQYPMLAVMILYTVLGLFLLLGA